MQIVEDKPISELMDEVAAEAITKPRAKHLWQKFCVVQAACLVAAYQRRAGARLCVCVIVLSVVGLLDRKCVWTRVVFPHRFVLCSLGGLPPKARRSKTFCLTGLTVRVHSTLTTFLSVAILGSRA